MYPLDGLGPMQGLADAGGDQYMTDGLQMDYSPFDFDMGGMAMPSNMTMQQQDQYQNGGMSGQQSGQYSQQELDNKDDDVDGMGPDGAAARQEGNTVIGDGPLPTSYGMQLTSTSGSHLTEFTKRRNWSQRVIEELKDFLHILSPDGRILYASPSAKTLTGHDASNLIGQLIFEYLHPDDASMFVREFNESISTGNALRFFYRFRRPDNSYAIFESHGHPHLTAEPGSFNPNVTPPSSLCRGFFMMSRLYPTKNASLLDSFLEHKIENERLKKRIAELKREEQEDLLAQRNASATPSHNPNSISRPQIPSLKPADSLESNTNSLLSDSGATPASQAYSSMPPPAKPTPSNHPLTQQNLSEVLAASRPDSINDKMARYEGVTHLESIEMLTGLLYRDGERANGISTGAASPTLIRGDAGIQIPVDKDGKPLSKYSGDTGISEKERKKKMKVADEYVCTDCGTLDSPEWRKGPMGPKTLCNACGLRWAKKEKKRTGVSVSGNGTTVGGSVNASVGSGSGTGTTPMQPQQGTTGAG